MIRFLRLEEVLELHRRVIGQSGGTAGLRDRGALEAAVVQPQMAFGDEDLYPTLADKAAALAFSLIQNHPFLDGNKRTGHATMELFLLLNRHEIVADTDDQEEVVLAVAAGRMKRDELREWV